MASGAAKVRRGNYRVVKDIFKGPVLKVVFVSSPFILSAWIQVHDPNLTAREAAGVFLSRQREDAVW